MSTNQLVAEDQTTRFSARIEWFGVFLSESLAEVKEAAVHAGSSRAPASFRKLSSTQAMITFDDPTYTPRSGSTLTILGNAKKSGLNVCLSATVRVC